MPKHTPLVDLIIAHHLQAQHIVRHTLRCQHHGVNPVPELKRVGNRFTTRVEKRLRRLEATQ